MDLCLAVLVANGDAGLGILVVQQRLLGGEPARTRCEMPAALGHYNIVVSRHRGGCEYDAVNQNAREDFAHYLFPSCCSCCRPAARLCSPDLSCCATRPLAQARGTLAVA